MLIVTSLLVLGFIALLRQAGPGRRAPAILPALLLVWASCAGATLLLQAILPLPVLKVRAQGCRAAACHKHASHTCLPPLGEEEEGGWGKGGCVEVMS